METINIYIDNIFRGLPETDEVLRAKSELSAVMEDKYNELKELGKSENEAIGIVISEFGNIDELISVVNKTGLTEANAPTEGAAIQRIDKATTVSYFEIVRKNAFAIPLGVFMIIFGVALMLLIAGFDYSNITELSKLSLSDDVMGRRAAVGLIIMIVMIIAGVITMVFNTLHLNEFTVFNGKFTLARDAEDYVTDAYKSFRPKKIKLITTGICIILLSVLVVISGALFSNEFGAMLSVAAMLILLGIGIMPLIHTGLYVTAYDKVLQRYSKEIEVMKKSDRITEIIAGPYWCLVTAIYLLVSFVWKSWDTSWIIWVVSALLFGGIAAFVSVAVKD